LFAQQLSEVVQQAFAATAGEAGVVEVTVPPEAPVEDRTGLPGAPDGPGEVAVVQDAEVEAIGADDDGPKVEQRVESLPARMLNEFVYCPRLFYYEHVEGVFVESADTVKGAAVHARVDKGKGALGKPESEKRKVESDASGGGDAADKSEVENRKSEITGDEIHSRSVMLGSERLGVVAKMDLVEATLSRDGSVAAVQPVDYKVGAPREGADGLELWDADKMQLGLQCLVLRDNGYACDTGIIYYRKTKQRVPLELTPELEAWVISKIAEARVCAQGPIPPPLVDSPKCARCSLAPVCLPDETRMLSIPTVESFAPAEERDGSNQSPITIHLPARPAG
jgi:CRISPR-associated protein Cas1